MPDLDRVLLADWCNEHLSSHSNYDAVVLDELPGLGLNLIKGSDRYGDYVEIHLASGSPGTGDKAKGPGNKGSGVGVRLSTWEDDFQSLLGRGLGLLILKPDAERDVEYFYAKSRKPVTTFDIDGNPKTKQPIYAVVKGDTPPPGWYGSWTVDTPEARSTLTFDPLDLVGALARLVNGTDEGSQYQGRGSVFRGSLKSIRGEE